MLYYGDLLFEGDKQDAIVSRTECYAALPVCFCFFTLAVSGVVASATINVRDK